MKKASITETKNHLSRLIEEVRNGNSILILDRKRPVARLEPVGLDEQATAEVVTSLVRDGLAAAPRRRFDPAAFLARPRVRLSEGTSAVDALLSERDEGR
ncbi:MAG: type II toxin-antitoxin system Phd/YefM family antitoxin [Spirochaetales bacterium]|nr:type II toxin-antitoxin system Phd/YefM family antitoxin [Spirochaetales bacterium]